MGGDGNTTGVSNGYGRWEKEQVESVVEAVSIAVITEFGVRCGGRLRWKDLGQSKEQLSEESGTSRMPIEFRLL